MSDNQYEQYYGAVIFDDKDSPTSGWMSVEGEAGRRISDQSQLRNDTIFWSNCPSFFGKNMLSNIRQENYIQNKLKDIMLEWDCDPEIMAPKEFAEIIATLFSRMMRMAKRLIKASDLGIPEDMFFTKDRLPQDIKTVLPAAEYPPDDSEMNDILKSGISFAYLTFTSINGNKADTLIPVRRPRLDHVVDIMSSPVPNGPFKYFNGRTLPKASEVAMLPKPVMAEIVMRNADSAVSPIYGFGVNANSKSRLVRSWVAQPELAIMTGFADIEIRNAWIGESYSILPQSMTKILQNFLTSKETSLSWSSGMLMDAIWAGAVVGRSSDGFSAIPRERLPQTSWRGAWLRACDKIITLRYAMMMHKAGFAVQSYHNGQVNCRVPQFRLEEFCFAAWKAGMVPQMKHIPRPFKSSELDAHPWGGTPDTKFWATLVMGKNSKALWELDDLPLAKAEDKQAIVSSVMKMIKN